MSILSINPWRGLAAYEEPREGNNPFPFCGRLIESNEVTSLIDDNLFVTLYGKSGIGKSSLVKAGVFPRLRKLNYFPVFLRLGIAADQDCFQSILIASVENELTKLAGKTNLVEIVPDEADTQSPSFLWSYFARHIFVNNSGEKVFPVIVFDQFEELFRRSYLRDKVSVLLRQIHYMTEDGHEIKDSIIDGKEYYYDYNFRFMVSIREDELYYLDDIIDDEYLTSLLGARYRLKPLSRENAIEIIETPCTDLFDKNDINAITERIISTSEDSFGRIGTNMLSLICNRLFQAFHNYGKAIDISIVDEFLSENLFRILYEEATEKLSEDERTYIEQHLIDSSGRRDSVSEPVFLEHVPNGGLLLEDGPNKILQRVTIASDMEHPRIELIHDSFCEPILSNAANKAEVSSVFSKAVGAYLWIIIFLAGVLLGAIMSFVLD